MDVQVQVKVGSRVVPYIWQGLVHGAGRQALSNNGPATMCMREQVLRCTGVRGLLEMLEERQTTRRVCRGSGLQVVYPQLSLDLRQVFGRPRPRCCRSCRSSC